MQNQVSRMEWRAVTEGTGRDRLSGDASGEHARMNGSARSRPNTGFHHESSRNGRIFHSGGSGSSSDSDHHSVDLKHGNASPQTGAQGADTKMYDEIQRTHKQAELVDSTVNGHLDGSTNSLSVEFGVINCGKNSTETLEQRLHDVIRQREQFQRVEAELRAQFIARSEVLRLQNTFEEQTKQQANIITSLQEQLQERDHRIHDLEQQLDEREQQLHANQREANEAVNQVWAKDGLLREQTNELATLRREYDSILAEQKETVGQFEVDRAQYLSQLQEVEEQIREKDHQLQELDEQRRNSQDALIYKDEQLREAQAWIQRAQELDAFHASANSSLHAELRDRTDQINQLWLGHQRQLADVERFHAQTIQRLRLEVAELRELNRVLKGGASSSDDKNETKNEQATHAMSKDGAHMVVADQTSRTIGRPTSGVVAASSNQVEHATGMPVPASPMLASAPPILPANPLPVLHPFPGQAQGIAASVSVPPQVTQSGLSQFTNPVIIPAPQQLPVLHQQGMQQDPKQVVQQPQPSQVQRFPHHPQQLHMYSHFPEAKSPISIPSRAMNHHQLQQSDQEVVLDQSDSAARKSVGDFSGTPDLVAGQHGNMQGATHQLQTGRHMVHAESNQTSEQQIGQHLQVDYVPEDRHELYDLKPSAQQAVEAQDFHDFHEATGSGQHQGSKPDQLKGLPSLPQQLPIIHVQQPKAPDSIPQSDPIQASVSSAEEQHIPGSQLTASHFIMNFERNKQHVLNSHITQLLPSVQQSATDVSSKVVEPVLLDEKALLVCLVRSIPSEASGRIKISTTLPNRLGKMLAPLHWHDYKKQFGRLDDFVSSHPELFVIDGDSIHLREGAHAIISATTTVAKVAAAAAAAAGPTMGAMWPPTVAVTPVAQSQSQRSRKSVAIGGQINLKTGHTSSHLQSADERLLSQLQINASSALNQGDLTKNAVLGECLAPQNQPRTASLTVVGKPGSQRVMTILGSRPEGLPFQASNINVLEFNEASSNTYGGPVVLPRKNGILYGNRQAARTIMLGTEPFGNQDLMPLSQTSDNRVSRSS